MLHPFLCYTPFVIRIVAFFKRPGKQKDETHLRSADGPRLGLAHKLNVGNFDREVKVSDQD